MNTPQIAIHLSFNGDCAEAFAHYERVLGGTINRVLTYGASPMADHVPPSEQNRVMHASLTLGGTQLMGADGVSSHPYAGSTGFSVSLSYPTAEQAAQVFEALGAGGAVIMPFGPTFWAKGFGVLTDRFGVSWMVGCDH